MVNKNVDKTWAEGVDKTLDNAKDASLGAAGGVIAGGYFGGPKGAEIGAAVGGTVGAYVGEMARAAGEALSGVNVQQTEREAEIMDKAKQIYEKESSLTPEEAREKARKEFKDKGD